MDIKYAAEKKVFLFFKYDLWNKLGEDFYLLDNQKQQGVLKQTTPWPKRRNLNTKKCTRQHHTEQQKHWPAYASLKTSCKTIADWKAFLVLT